MHVLCMVCVTVNIGLSHKQTGEMRHGRFHTSEFVEGVVVLMVMMAGRLRIESRFGCPPMATDYAYSIKYTEIM